MATYKLAVSSVDLFCGAIEENCPNPIRARGLCERHYRRFKVWGTPYQDVIDKLKEKREAAATGTYVGKMCQVETCTKAIRAKGYCMAHYQQARFLPEPGEEPNEFPVVQPRETLSFRFPLHNPDEKLSAIITNARERLFEELHRRGLKAVTRPRIVVTDEPDDAAGVDHTVKVLVGTVALQARNITERVA